MKYNYEYFERLRHDTSFEFDDDKMSAGDMKRLESFQESFRSKMTILGEIRDLKPGDLTDEKRTIRDSLLSDVKGIVDEIDKFPKRKSDNDIDIDFDNNDHDSNQRQAHGGPVQKRDYRSMFYPADSGRSLDRGNFRNTSEFIEVVGSGLFDPRLKRASMIEGISSSGGFSVPDEFSAQWLDDSLPTEIVRPLCQVWPMKSSDRKIPGWDGADMSSGELFGGFKMEILAEEGTASKQTGKVPFDTP
jgi:HK97 family phage major capsid protein